MILSICFGKIHHKENAFCEPLGFIPRLAHLFSFSVGLRSETQPVFFLYLSAFEGLIHLAQSKEDQISSPFFIYFLSPSAFKSLYFSSFAFESLVCLVHLKVDNFFYVYFSSALEDNDIYHFLRPKRERCYIGRKPSLKIICCPIFKIESKTISPRI